MPAFQKLVSQVRACTLCAKHLPLGPRPVFQLHPDARILIASQAPGRKVHETGIPFNDLSGDRLRLWLGIDRETFYNPHIFAIVPMGLCYPGKGKNGDLPPRPECAPRWRQPLLGSIRNLRLTLAIGLYAIRYHLPGQQGPLTPIVQNWRASWPYVVPMPHPSPLNNGWFVRNKWFEEELLPVLRKQISKIVFEG